MTRILVAVPCFDQLYADFAFSLVALVAYGKATYRVQDCRGSDIVGARNAAAVMAIEEGFTHLMFIDSDMAFPPDTVERLLAHGKPVVGATYIRRCEPYNLLGLVAEKWEDKPLVEALELPTGCLLINVSALKKVGWPYFAFEYGDNPGERIGEDIWFCRKWRETGGKIYCDAVLTRQLGHIGIKKYTVQDGIEHIARKQMEARRGTDKG